VLKDWCFVRYLETPGGPLGKNGGVARHVSFAAKLVQSTIWCATPRRGLSWQKVQKFIQLLVQIEYKLGLNRNC